MKNISKILNKVRNCVNYNSLFSLEESFNSVGLTLQPTPQNWMILCRIRNKRPLAEEVTVDFVHLATLENKEREITPRALEVLTDFIQQNATSPAKVENTARVWRNGIRTYEASISIVNESVSRVAQTVNPLTRRPLL